MAIDYENDLLKHYVRRNAWLPVCRRRLATIRTTEQPRRLRYFTFCARHAMDVLMLDVARVVTKSKSGRFDSVVFFDRDQESILDTNKRIPGAIGFPGNFISVMLLVDPEEGVILDEAALAAPPDKPDELAVRKGQQQLAQRRKFMSCFPFDVINLDLEDFLFKPREELPGKVINAFQKLCEWQKQPLERAKGPKRPLDGFSLMFTTQIGPANMADPCKKMLGDYLRGNLEADNSLREMLRQRAMTDDIDSLRDNQFDMFFTLGMPKVLANTLLENDWYVEPTQGIQVFQFERPSTDGPYQMVHLVMDVIRQQPPKGKRPPGPNPTGVATTAYRQIARMLFQTPETMVAEASFSDDVRAELLDDLIKIKARADRYAQGR